ncbi:sensor histidine kinase [Lachnospiraceae bacterium LCP25S3_G4]
MKEIYYLDVILIAFYCAAFFCQYKRWINRFAMLYKSVEREVDINIDDVQPNYLEEEILTYIINHKENKYAKELKEKEQQLKDMEEYISKWVHEIKLPISTISMLQERMEEEQLSSEIKNEMEKINFLVNSVLYGSRATATAEDIFISEQNLEKIVREAVKSNAFLLIKNKIEIKLENLDYELYTDKKWILYVLDQLINNAIKYAKDPGEIKFYGEEKEHCVCLNIRDSGIGIAQEDQERIFHKGFTGNNGRNSRYKSTGMGLYFSKKILDKLGNSFEVESVKNEYTLFRISFHKISDFTSVSKM